MKARRADAQRSAASESRTKGEGRMAVTNDFPVQTRWTVSGLRADGICFECECRIAEIEGDHPMTLAWCECVFPEDHHEMEIL